MDLDVRGKNGERFDLDDEGHYDAVALFCRKFAPEIASRCRHWHTNYGHGLDAADAIKLADRIQAEIDCGRAQNYAYVENSRLEMMPDWQCRACGGTGGRRLPPKKGAGPWPCDWCGQRGYFRPPETRFILRIDILQDFVRFLRRCNGFVIGTGPKLFP